MRLIFLNQAGASKTLHLNKTANVLLLIGLLCLPLLIGTIAGYRYQINSKEIPVFFDNMSKSLKAELRTQSEELNRLQITVGQKLQTLNAHVGVLQARIIGIEAFGEYVGQLADLKGKVEFDFCTSPALGGPLEAVSFSQGTVGNQEDNIITSLASLENKIQDRLLQMEWLSQLLFLEREKNSLFGWPVKNGWISSNYGLRSDPFTGATAWHKGIDIAGELSSEVLAIAEGVVTFVGKRASYGQLIEIAHEGNYITRYGHNKNILVDVGQPIKKGEMIGRMGSTGRSTGPHIHFEVIKGGHNVNPILYIQNY